MRDTVARLVAFRETEVVILRLEIDERQQQLVLDHLPENAGHFIAVHLYERRGHLNAFFHVAVPLPVSGFVRHSSS